MVNFQIFPESPGQVVGQVFQTVVVQAGLAFAQVGDQQVTDRAASELVAVDQLFGRELEAGAESPEPQRSLLAEEPEVTKDLVGSAGGSAAGRARSARWQTAPSDCGAHAPGRHVGSCSAGTR